MSGNQVVVAARPMNTRGVKWTLSAMVLAVAAAFALSAEARPAERGQRGMGEGGPGMMMSGRGVDHMLDGLDASEAQRTQIKQIYKAAAEDLKGQREQRRTLRERSLQILAAPTVDAAAAESVRQQMLQQHDQSSRRMLQASIDASQVLTPEQRAKLAERLKQRSEMMRERMERGQPRQ